MKHAQEQQRPNAIEVRLDEVRSGHQRGWIFTPLNGKRPVRPAWQKEEPADLRTIEGWARQGNVGLRTGQVSGVVVIDDDRDDMSAPLPFSLQQTPTVITGSGKRHYYCQCPASGLGNSVSRLAPNIDVRGDGGQVVFPGSVHPETGQVYRWADGLSPDDVSLAKIPKEVLKRLQPNGHSGTDTHSETTTSRRYRPQGKNKELLDEFVREQLSQSQRRVASASKGLRNDTLNREAFRMARYSKAGLINEWEVRGSLGGAAISAGLSKSELKATLKSAMRAPIRRELDVRRLCRRLRQLALDRQVRELQRRAAEPAGAGKPKILVANGELPRIVSDLDRVFSSLSQPVVYQRGNSLTRVVRFTPPVVRTGIIRPENAYVLQNVDVHFLVDEATRIASFLVPTLDGVRSIDCPQKYAKTYISRGQWLVPTLVGLVEAPTLRFDGSVLQHAGYDAKSRLLMVSGPTPFPRIPDSPTAQEAQAALALLLEPISKFPFLEEADRAVAVAAILTALVRRSLPSSPLFAIGAPIMGSGKSLLADLIALIAMGRTAAVMTQGKDEDEDRKRVLALLLQGDAVAVIDNLERPLGGAALCSILTQETYKDRILGESRIVTVPTNVMWIGTGNNIQYEGDIVTRVVPCDLDPKCERPEERKFEGNLREQVLANRAQLASAGITLLRGYLAARAPGCDLVPFGRFEQWSDWIRSTVVWAGMPDPCSTRKRLQERDPVTERLRALLLAWFAQVGEKDVTVAELTAKSDSTLGRILAEVSGDGPGQFNGRRIGKYLARFQGRIVDGLCVERIGHRSGITIWLVRQVSSIAKGPTEGFAGSMGSSNPTRDGKNTQGE